MLGTRTALFARLARHSLRLRVLALAALVAAVTGAACTKELHRKQGAVLVTGDGWGEIAPCG